MATTFSPIDHHPLMLQPVEVVHLGGGISQGLITSVDGRAGEVLSIAFTSGPLAQSSFMVRGLARANLTLTSPVSVPMLGELRRVETA